MFWLAYHSDFSGMAVFESEIEALRYAVKRSMDVVGCRYGKELTPGMKIERGRVK